jgi:divalent metal cation (Fe/Co/Zn/Cd) transporter
MTMAPRDRHELLRSAVLYSFASVGWGVLSGICGVFVGIAGHSVALLAFGLGALLDAIASAVLIRRFGLERRDPPRADALERSGLRIVGWLLVGAGIYVIGEAVRSLLSESEPGTVLAPAIITGTSAAVLAGLGRGKLKLSRTLGSRALRADATLSLLGSVLSISILLGLGLEAAFGWRWIDPAAALAVSAVLFREGGLAIRAARASD